MATSFGTNEEGERMAEGGYFSATLLADADATVRQGFIRKVYSILAVQILLTAAIAAPIMQMDDKWVKDHQPLVMFSLFMTLAIMCAGICYPSMFRKYPQNYFFLFLFTGFEAVAVGFICAAFTFNSVYFAFGLTSAIFISLTIYAMTTETDFTGFGPYLMGALFGLIFMGFLAMFIPGLQAVYNGCGAILFSFYIIHDTQLIMGGKHTSTSFSIDDYCFACLTIYLDIINLFIFILQMFGDRR